MMLPIYNKKWGGVGLAAFMLAMLLPLPAAATYYTNPSVCEGQRLSFGVARPRADLYGGSLTYKIRVAGGSARAGQDYEQPVGEITFSAGVNGVRFYVKTFRDEINEGHETVKLQLYEPKAPRYNGWIQYNGNWVRVESLMRKTITRYGAIHDAESGSQSLEVGGLRKGASGPCGRGGGLKRLS